jgi:hypothetical protein
MNLSPRYFFYGYAAAIGGRIYRPEPFDIEVEGASALTFAGGISRSEIRGKTFGPSKYIEFKRATTHAEGRYDERRALAVTNHELLHCELDAKTTTRSEVEGLRIGVGRTPVLSVGRIVAEMVGYSPNVNYQPAIKVTRETQYHDIFISLLDRRFGLRIEVNHELFDEYDTYAKLLAALDDRDFTKEHGSSLFLAPEGRDRDAAPQAGTLQERRQCPPRLESKDVLYATIVRDIRWIDEEPSFAKIDGHTVVVDDFGTIYFGEILIRSSSRRLSMMRLELGSPDGGNADLNNVGQEGMWAP